MANIIRVSPSTMHIFRDCPRCFWLHMNKKVSRPRGIFPSLPSGMDGVLKTYFDGYRAKGCYPPELVGKLPGVPMPNLQLMETMRNWRTSPLEYTDVQAGIKLTGALDDLAQDGVIYIPLDFKTKGKKADQASSERYYKWQLSAYNLMLLSQKYQINDTGYLIYYSPNEVHDNGLVLFDVEVFMIKTDIQMVKNDLKAAALCLQSPTLPMHSTNCEYCKYTASRAQTIKAMLPPPPAII